MRLLYYVEYYLHKLFCQTQFPAGHLLWIEAVIEQFALHPGPQTLAASIVVAAAALAVHALENSVFFHRCPVGLTGVLAAPVRVDNGALQPRIGSVSGI